jgi:hypothetical protein
MDGLSKLEGSGARGRVNGLGAMLQAGGRMFESNEVIDFFFRFT